MECRGVLHTPKIANAKRSAGRMQYAPTGYWAKNVLPLLFMLLVLWLGTFFASKPLKEEKSQDFWQRERITAVISSPDIVPFLLGFETVFAHYLWIRTVLYTGEEIFSGGDGKWLREMILAINMLHPQFYPPYEFAAVMLPQLTGDWEGARMILENGTSRVRGRNQRLMYFYLGWIYYSQFQDYTRAAALFAYASQFPNTPPHWARLSATALAQAGRAEQGIMFLLDMFEATDDPQVKRVLLERIKSLYEENQGNLPFELPREFLEKEL